MNKLTRTLEIIGKTCALFTIGARAIDEPKSSPREYHASWKGVVCDSSDYIEDWQSIRKEMLEYVCNGSYHPSVSVVTHNYIKENKGGRL